MAQTAYVNEKESRAVYVTTDVDTSGTTVGIYLVGPDGTANLVGTTAGVAASTQMTFVCDFTLNPNMYRMEIVSDVSADNPVTIWPDSDNEEYYVRVRNVASLP